MGNSPVTGEFPTQRPVTRSLAVSFDLPLDKRLSKQSWCRWFEMQSRSLWRHGNGTKLMWYRTGRHLGCHWIFPVFEMYIPEIAVLFWNDNAHQNYCTLQHPQSPSNVFGKIYIWERNLRSRGETLCLFKFRLNDLPESNNVGLRDNIKQRKSLQWK